MKLWFSYILLTLILFSCGGKGDGEVVDMSEISPKANNQKDYSDKSDQMTDSISFVDSLPKLYRGIIDSLKIDHWNVQKMDTTLLPDRFNAKSNLKLCWKMKNDSVSFLHWSFKDSIRTNTAFYNWLDCFGAKCKSIRVGEQVNFQKRNMLIMVNDNNMIFIDSDKKIEAELWIQLLKDQKMGENWKFIIVQPRKGKANWSKYKDEVFSEIIAYSVVNTHT